MSAESPITAQWPDPQLQDYSSKSYALSGRIMLASIVILFVVVFFLVLLHLYARWYLLRLRRRQHRRTRRRTRIVFYVDTNRVPPSPTAGLDSSVLKSLPLFVYSPGSYETTPECAVCLSEFEEGETGRVLPKCKHSFHTQCIDMWFCSNSTCPLCRSPVEPPPVEPEMKTSVNQQEPPGSPAVEAVTETETETASFANTRKRVDVRIEVPTRPTGNELVTSSELQVTSPSQGFRSPGARLLALKRIMNWRSPAPSPTAAAAAGVGPSCVIPVANGESGDKSQMGEITEVDMLAATVYTWRYPERVGGGLRCRDA